MAPVLRHPNPGGDGHRHQDAAAMTNEGQLPPGGSVGCNGNEVCRYNMLSEYIGDINIYIKFVYSLCQGYFEEWTHGDQLLTAGFI
jgi:hypothetical protein